MHDKSLDFFSPLSNRTVQLNIYERDRKRSVYEFYECCYQIFRVSVCKCERELTNEVREFFFSRSYELQTTVYNKERTFTEVESIKILYVYVFPNLASIRLTCKTTM